MMMMRLNNNGNGTFEGMVGRSIDGGGGSSRMPPPLIDDDVKLVGSRLYVGNINDKITRGNIENRFSKYGQIIGVTMHEGGCYVQYEDETNGRLAIKGEHGSIMFGNKLEVRMERDLLRPELVNVVQDATFVSPGSPIRRRSPSDIGRRGLRERSRDRGSYHRPSYRDRSPSSTRGPARRDSENRNRYDSPTRDRSIRGTFDDGSRDRSIDSRDLPPQHKARNSFDDSDDHARTSKVNDCELIVMNRSLRSYAQLVDRKLKRAGLHYVETQYAKDDTTVIRLLRDIGERGCLYAIVIQPQNEFHNSITVNILQGTPQEHRNMPLDDAMKFISINFEMHSRERAAKKIAEKLCGPPIPPLQAQQAFIASNNPMVPSFAAPEQRMLNSHPLQQMNIHPPQQMNIHPPQQINSQQQHQVNNQSLQRMNSQPKQRFNSSSAISSERDVETLIQFLANGKQLSVMELDRVIKHLEETRSKLIASNSGATYRSDPDHPRQHLELQQKINSLFGGSASSSGNMPVDNTRRQETSLYEGIGNSGVNTGESDGVRRRKGGEGRWGPPIKQESAANSSLNINLENPNIQKALDNLLQSGPNILKCLDVPEDRDLGYSNNSRRAGQQGLDRPYSEGMASRNMDVSTRNMPLLSTPSNRELQNMTYMQHQREQDLMNVMRMDRSMNRESRNVRMNSRDIDSRLRDFDSRNMGMISPNMELDNFNRGSDLQRDGLRGGNMGPGNMNQSGMNDSDRYDGPIQGRNYQGGQAPFNQRPFF